MKYLILAQNSLPFNRSLNFDWNGYFLGKGGNQIGWIKKVSTYNYQELKHIDLWYNVSSNFSDCKYFKTKPQKFNPILTFPLK